MRTKGEEREGWKRGVESFRLGDLDLAVHVAQEVDVAHQVVELGREGDGGGR